MDINVTPTQRAALSYMVDSDKEYTAEELNISISTMNALQKKGYIKLTNPNTQGTPANVYKWKRLVDWRFIIN